MIFISRIELGFEYTTSKVY